MKRYFTLLFFSLFLCGCTKAVDKDKKNEAQEELVTNLIYKKKNKKDTLKVVKTNKKKYAVSKSLDKKEAEIFVEKFYNWYLFQVYPAKATYYESPPYIKKEGCFVFSEKILVERLKSVEYFSESYIKDKIEKLKKCNEALFKEKITIEPEGGMDQEDCYYLDRYEFVTGNGERFDGFEIISSEEKENSVLVTLHLKIENQSVAVSKILVNKFDSDQFKIVKVVEVDWI